MEYATLAEYCRRLEAADADETLVETLAELFRTADADHLPLVVTMVRGKVAPRWEQVELGVSSSLTREAIVRATGVDGDALETEWRDRGDLGAAAEWAVGESPQTTLVSETLTVAGVHEQIRALADLKGAGSESKRVETVAGLLADADPEEARYLVRTVLGYMRVGVGDGTIRDAVAEAFLDADGEPAPGTPTATQPAVDAVEAAFQVTNDYREVAATARDRGIDGLRELDVRLGRPVESMLAQKAEGLAAGLANVARGDDRTATVSEGRTGTEVSESTDETSPWAGRVLAEVKYDGVRVQAHVDGDDVWLFTRRLVDVTEQFPEVVAALRGRVTTDRALLDGELVGYDPESGAPVPFQEFSRRIRQEEDVAGLAAEIPAVCHLFDCLVADEETLLDAPLRERLDLLDETVAFPDPTDEPVGTRDLAPGDRDGRVTPDDEAAVSDETLPSDAAPGDDEHPTLRRAAWCVPSDEAAARSFYRAAVEAGHEGVMVKNLAASYQPGRRVGQMLKHKPVMEPLDLVVTRATYSEGRRSELLGRLFLGAYDPDAESFHEVGRLSTGYTDEELERLTERLEELVVSRDGRDVDLQPEVVLEVEYEEIQSSPEYASGYALRFPRFLGVRGDLDPSDADTVARVESLYDEQ
ncbi:DNA ligase [Halobaculum sp. MBLA0147]|uniref:ATP-dependent DNA ligase n=1 Tax=Halobaculum sp. MBLA0147 TaxID=3079934 RepID=UPI003525C3C0